MINYTMNLPPQVEPEEFVTKDLYLAAAILAVKAGDLVQVDKAEPRHMKFCFNGVRLSSIEADWTNRRLTVNAADFADAIRKMKSIIHASE